MQNKTAYEKPELHVYGNVTELTLGTTTGDFTDAAFPTDTPKEKLTFS